MHRNGQIISSLHVQSWTPTSRASPIGKLFPFNERCELPIKCLVERGKVNVTSGLNGKSETSIKGSCKQYVKSGSVFTGSHCAEILRLSFCIPEWCFCFHLKARIMFEVEGEMQGRINIYEANLSGMSQFFSSFKLSMMQLI